MKALFTGLLAAALLAGCAGSNPGSSSAPSNAVVGGIELVASHAGHLSGTPADASSAGQAVDAFGLDLYRATAGGSKQNLVVSPASIALALAMARAGAAGATAAEMDKVLHDLGTDAHAGWLASLDAALNARTGSFPDGMGKSQDVTLRVVNTNFAQRGLALQPAFLDALATRLGAGVRLVDYKTAPEAARRLINGWVSDQTEQRIRELLGQGTIDELTRLVLVNAIYLKAAWQAPFDESATVPARFTTIDGATPDVPTMHMSEELRYASGAGWQAVELPYVGGKLAMDVILPADLRAFDASLDATLLASIVGGLAETQVILSLPRFKAETHVDLSKTLAGLGMPTAFTDAADFSGITKDEQLQITAVIHQANIDVDEHGTTAAAATAVVVGRTSLPANQATMTVDHPFLFALRDLETGALLFLGRITDPAATAG